MSEQGDLFVRKYLHGDPTPTTFAFNVGFLRQLAGSERAAAKLAGVHHASFQRWRKGAQPRPAMADRIAAAVRNLRTGPATDPTSYKVIRGDTTKHRRRREQSVSASQINIQPGAMAAARVVWVTTGDTDAAGRKWADHIQEPWYHKRFKANFSPDEVEYFDQDYGITLA